VNTKVFVWWLAMWEWRGNAAMCLQRIRIFIPCCSDVQICRTEGHNAIFCLPIQLFHTNCNTDCWLTITFNVKCFGHSGTIPQSCSVSCLFFSTFQLVLIFTFVHLALLNWCSLSPATDWYSIVDWISFPLLLTTHRKEGIWGILALFSSCGVCGQGRHFVLCNNLWFSNYYNGPLRFVFIKSFKSLSPT
jgi:hypothetical protein